jgi:hypothetical protein
VTLANTAARRDPLVGGVDEFFQLGIGDDAFRQKAAGARDACVDQSRSLAFGTIKIPRAQNARDANARD